MLPLLLSSLNSIYKILLKDLQLCPWCSYSPNKFLHQGHYVIFLCICSLLVLVFNRSVVSNSLRPQWTVALEAPLSMGFSRQEYWSGLLCPSPGDILNPRIKLKSPSLQADSLPSEPPGKPQATSKQGQKELQSWSVAWMMQPSLRFFSSLSGLWLEFGFI